MANNYGGVVQKTAGNVQRQISRTSAEDSADTLHASTLSGYVEALFAEQYAAEQCADGGPGPINYAERRGF